MLRLSEKEFRRLTLKRIIRAMEWVHHEDEMLMVHTRLICYYQGNHKVDKPEELWRTASEQRKFQIDLIEGRIPMAKFKRLTEEEVKNWQISKN